jgi:hypothetical protein
VRAGGEVSKGGSELTRRSILFLIPVLAVVLAGCPKVIPGVTIRIEEIEAACRGATFTALAFQGDTAIGRFEMRVTHKLQAEFIIPQGVAQRIDFNQPVYLRIYMTGGSSEACVLAGRVMTFRGVLTKKGTDPRTGNPVYILKFYEDFKIEYH